MDDMSKRYNTFLLFLSNIKDDKSHIIFAPDYVVMDRKSFELIVNKHEEIKFLDFDQLNDWIEKQFLGK